MKRVIAEVLAATFVAAIPASPAPKNSAIAGPPQMVVTVRPTPGDDRSVSLEAGDVTVMRGSASAQVVRLERLTGSLSDMQLFVLLDDSSPSSLALQFPELRKFIDGLPATTQVALGYMRNGTFGLVEAFTADHDKVAGSLRLPASIPGENGSPYFVLSDLAKHWPSKQSTHRRAVLMLTDGVDPYYGSANMDDPYVNAAIHDALKEGVMVYSIYFHGAGEYGRSQWATNLAQSRLIKVSEETGGYAYSLGTIDPVTISPFLKDFEDRLENQYQVTLGALNDKGVQSVRLRTDLRGLKIDAPTRIFVR